MTGRVEPGARDEAGQAVKAGRIPPGLRRFLLYSFCGGSGVAFDFLIYASLVSVDVWHHAANIAGYLGGTIVSFLLNRVVTFRVLDRAGRRFAAFLGVAALGYLASTLVLAALVDGLGVGEIPAKLASIVVVVAIQYTLNARFTFRR